jgi:peptide-methionine (S)-S-oxide reductase
VKVNMPSKFQKATFAAGCFWHVEESFRKVPGVVSTAVGYEGGNFDDPTYKDVCTGKTGHAEAVEVEFDPSKVTYGDLLNVFWSAHDPTTKDRQGPDSGTQYRSAIFFQDKEQEAEAKASRDKQEGKFKDPIVTQIVPATMFWKAEEYHQRYLEKNKLKSCGI